ncbi:MAG: hypothetical protein K6T65_01555 [Peptococcaceae bacterium]|nr:hypothetical protein [Peptococcaceae bacterium]
MKEKPILIDEWGYTQKEVLSLDLWQEKCYACGRPARQWAYLEDNGKMYLHAVVDGGCLVGHMCPDCYFRWLEEV